MIAKTFARFVLLGLFGLLFQSTETLAFTRPVVMNPAGMTRNAATSFARVHVQQKMAATPGPAVLDKPKTVEKVSEDKVTQKDEKLGSDGWEIRLFNDPFNKREFVARCLATICGKSDTESYQIMMQAHNNGMGVVGRYMYEVAELYYKSLQENGLLVDMVPVDDE